MAVCQFFVRGQCRFGDSCRNEHPADARQSGFGTNTWGRTSGGAAADAKPALPFNAANIASDWNPKGDKPIWPLSSYGPAKHEPLLISGLDESQEELRVKAVTAIRAGNLNEYLQYEANQIAAADQVYMNARNNSAQAYEQAVKQSKLPALIAGTTTAPSAFGAGTSASAFPSTSSAFGSTSTTTPSAFGVTTTPSAFRTTTAPSAFGSASTPSAFGSTSTPSVFGTSATTTSAFGKPAFGQSAFGQPSFGQPAFGQTSTPGTTTSAFSQPQQQQQAPSVFGQPTQPAAAVTSAFGQPSFGQPNPAAAAAAAGSPSLIKPASGAFGAFSGTGQSVFGSGSTAPAAGTGGGGAFSAFSGQPSAFGLAAAGGSNVAAQQTGGSVFGQPAFGQPAPPPAAPAATTSVFGIPAQGATSVFGTPSAFGQQQQQQPAPAPSAFGGGGVTSAFSTNINQPPTGSVFGQPAFGAPTQQPTSVFGVSGPAASAFGGAGGTAFTATNNTQPLSAFAPTAPSISMKSAASSSSTLDFSRMKATYKPGSTPYDELLPQNYAQMLPKSALEAFQSAKFEWGKVPEWIPPLDVR